MYYKLPLPSSCQKALMQYPYNKPTPQAFMVKLLHLTSFLTMQQVYYWITRRFRPRNKLYCPRSCWRAEYVPFPADHLVKISMHFLTSPTLSFFLNSVTTACLVCRTTAIFSHWTCRTSACNLFSCWLFNHFVLILRIREHLKEVYPMPSYGSK